MSKLGLSDVGSLQNEQTALATINNNTDILEQAFDNSLSRDGTVPNSMEADLDMNSNRLLNLAAPIEDTDAARYGDISSLQTEVDALVLDGITFDTAVDVVAKQIGLIDTKLSLTTASINANINVVRTLGFSVIDDQGGATYKRISTPSPARLWHVQSGDGSWWEIVDEKLNMKAIGAISDFSTNNDSILAAGATAISLGLYNKHLYFPPTGTYNFGSSWDLSGMEDYIISGGGCSGVSHLGAHSCLCFTGTSGSAINATEAKGIQIRDIDLAYSAAFGGILLNISCVSSVWNKNRFQNLHFYKRTGTGPFSCSLIFAYRSVDNYYESIRFSHATSGVVGALNGISGANSAAATFVHCDFVYVTQPIINPGLNWVFYGCRFEPSFTLAPATIFGDSATDIEGLSFHGCSFSDPTNAAGTWIDVHNWFGGGCFGCTFAGDIDLGGGAAIVNAARANHFYGVAFVGNLFSGVTNSVISTTTGSDIFYGGNSHPSATNSVFAPTTYGANTVFVGNNTPDVLFWNRTPIYVKAGLPAASAMQGAIVFVGDEAGGAVIAFSDGTNWRRLTDRAIVS